MSFIICFKRKKYTTPLAFYQVIVKKKGRSIKSNNFFEHLGFYNKNFNYLNLNFYRLFYWLGRGTRISNSFLNLLLNFI
jgi:ribosomal protein S16